MIDFVKSFNCNLDPSQLLKNRYLKFPVVVDPDTGEVLKKNRYSDYNGITFSIYQSGKVRIAGSLHKYFNMGLHNYNDFHFSDLITTIQDLYDRFGINPLEVYLNNLEFGVNIELDFKPRVLIDSLVTHHYKSFNVESKSIILYAYAQYDNYILKIYDKGLQFGLNRNLLRIEIKVLRMAYLKNTGIKTLWDLTDCHKLIRLKEILINVVDDILFWDKSIDKSHLSKRELELINKGCNPKFWPDHLEEAGKNASKKMRHYKELIRKHGGYQFHLIGDLIQEKWDLLLAQDSKTLRLLTEFQNTLLSKKLRVLTEIQNEGVDVPVSYYNISITSSDNSGKGGNVVTPDNKGKKVCTVTGIDISMQKEESRFLCITGIRYLYKNNRQQYDILLSELPTKWHNAPREVQEYKITHHIRDKFFNPRNSTRRAINKICARPALFDNRLLVSKEKLAIAETP